MAFECGDSISRVHVSRSTEQQATASRDLADRVHGRSKPSVLWTELPDTLARMVCLKLPDRAEQILQPWVPVECNNTTTITKLRLQTRQHTHEVAGVALDAISE